MEGVFEDGDEGGGVFVGREEGVIAVIWSGFGLEEED